MGYPNKFEGCRIYCPCCDIEIVEFIDTKLSENEDYSGQHIVFQEERHAV